MKIINIHNTVTLDTILTLLKQKLNPMFQEQKQNNINFTIERKGDAIEIAEPELYDGFLFRIEVNGLELYITRSEHYIDDINAITLESVLNILYEELSDDKG